MYADDLNGYKAYPTTVKNEVLYKEGRNCQDKLHTWSRANQIYFDTKKESFHILGRGFLRTAAPLGSWTRGGVQQTA